nr:MAG TPA: hypothetical protein [Caudoviricetes sp.]
MVSNLKEKVICEYQDLLHSLKKGYRLDYQLILEEISLIELLENKEMDDKKSMFISQFYLNNKWQITLS